MKEYEPIQQCRYGKLKEKVNLLPDFFTGFSPEKRKEIVEEEKFYHSITQLYVADQLNTFYTSFFANDGFEVPVKVYNPKKCTGDLPALVFIHGGRFMTCSVETHDFVTSYIAAKGI